MQNSPFTSSDAIHDRETTCASAVGQPAALQYVTFTTRLAARSFCHRLFKSALSGRDSLLVRPAGQLIDPAVWTSRWSPMCVSKCSASPHAVRSACSVWRVDSSHTSL
ncbi:hypothetical protein AOQ84DRAFT_123202 [Glonium stellatum]|uniref:Uncharacterized protein n=1 Tax=Glonium stellatum TaxID=574774 RepID=A0A8E2JP09_9PEZI|nr:hypothetical protein AOQ84DRAFT_123202 [Glonium stellatum]